MLGDTLKKKKIVISAGASGIVGFMKMI